MARKTKTETSTESAPIVEQSVAPKVEKVKKTKTVKTEEKVAAPAPVSAAPVEQTAAPEQTEVESSFTEKAQEFLDELNQWCAMGASLKTKFKSLEKLCSKEIKSAQKQNSKRKRKAGNRAPSGFVKPTRISDELAKFLDKPAGTEMARTDVTRDINKYIRAHDLQDKENGRKINPDTKLTALLKLKKTDELTYFNLQRYMKPHFASTKTETA
jgi:chromatin remodeling complex protein RSC6